MQAFGGNVKVAKAMSSSPTSHSWCPARGAEDLLGIHAPWLQRWPCAILWVCAEAVLSIAWLKNAVGKPHVLLNNKKHQVLVNPHADCCPTAVVLGCL